MCKNKYCAFSDYLLARGLDSLVRSDVGNRMRDSSHKFDSCWRCKIEFEKPLGPTHDSMANTQNSCSSLCRCYVGVYLLHSRTFHSRGFKSSCNHSFRSFNSSALQTSSPTIYHRIILYWLNW